MSNISVSLPSDGDTIDVADYNTPITTIVNEINGNLDNSNIKSDAAIDGTKVKDYSLGVTKLISSAVSQYVDTEQSTASTSYTDLGTVGPTVTATITTSGLALIILQSAMTNGTSNQVSFVSFSASGSNTIAASDAKSIIQGSPTGAVYSTGSYAALLTGLTAGSTVFTMSYKASAGTAYFKNRVLTVIPL